MPDDNKDETEFGPDNWIKVGTGEKTGFMAEYHIPNTRVSIQFDAGDTFWNLSDENKVFEAIMEALRELAIQSDR